ncbi:GmrSD restriction endonuclease domain-containing protein [Streptococcus loxodontisalivarius]|uniref:GmrSD restriction endonucleases C-terminal domain-containing protein n=1 Tax=Streptococcus loxodontisalivarius TaxID=1349415 RepID=A0ABS2PRM5_9STRE|nr:DUF1524 domain-containing protein [Streptococcus loxodontisalivarius]MBM7642693.1 hypothetical protein [Streptococcus loxodontisalivarius]
MEITIKQFEEQFVKIYGRNVWNDFNGYSRNEILQKLGFESIQKLEEQLSKYVKRIEEVKDFYRHKQFARFVLISIEKFKRSESNEIDFSRLYNESFTSELPDSEKFWEVEHIFSLNNFNRVFSQHLREQTQLKNNIANLTLISRRLNGSEPYKYADFNRKRELIKDYEEKDFFINRIFHCEADNEDAFVTLLQNRKQSIISDFKDIFQSVTPSRFDTFYTEILGISENI